MRRARRAALSHLRLCRPPPPRRCRCRSNRRRERGSSARTATASNASQSTRAVSGKLRRSLAPLISRARLAGELIATASAKGTIVRVFSSTDLTLRAEFRRGAANALITRQAGAARRCHSNHERVLASHFRDTRRLFAFRAITSRCTFSNWAPIKRQNARGSAVRKRRLLEIGAPLIFSLFARYLRRAGGGGQRSAIRLFMSMDEGKNRESKTRIAQSFVDGETLIGQRESSIAARSTVVCSDR